MLSVPARPEVKTSGVPDVTHSQLSASLKELRAPVQQTEQVSTWSSLKPISRSGVLGEGAGCSCWPAASTAAAAATVAVRVRAGALRG